MDGGEISVETGKAIGL